MKNLFLNNMCSPLHHTVFSYYYCCYIFNQSLVPVAKQYQIAFLILLFGSHFADFISSSLNSQSCFDKASLLASLPVFSSLQSAKYLPVTPLS